MQPVYTKDEVAELLALEPEVVGDMIATGHLSGFVVDEEWRTTHRAVMADLYRANLPYVKPALTALVPRAFETEESIELTQDEDEAPQPEKREQFRVRINVDNDSNYSGDFLLRLGAEGENAWEAFEAEGCDVENSEVRVRRSVHDGYIGVLFEGTIRGSYGDRLFVTVPEQQGIERSSEQVFVLENDTDVKLTLVKNGLLRRRTGVRFGQA